MAGGVWRHSLAELELVIFRSSKRLFKIVAPIYCLTIDSMRGCALAPMAPLAPLAPARARSWPSGASGRAAPNGKPLFTDCM